MGEDEPARPPEVSVSNRPDAPTPAGSRVSLPLQSPDTSFPTSEAASVRKMQAAASSRLVQAAADGDGPRVEYLLSQSTTDVVPDLRSRADALCIACHHGNSTMVARLIEAAADCCFKDADGNTPMHLALMGDGPGALPTVFAILGCQSSLPEAAHELFRRSLNAPNGSGETVLSIACRRTDAGIVQVVRALLNEGAAVTAGAIEAAASRAQQLVPQLVGTFLDQRPELLAKMRAQRILDTLDPHAHVPAVLSELLIEVQGFTSLGLVKAFVRGFRDDPYEAFSDAVVLATAYLSEARAVHNDKSAA